MPAAVVHGPASIAEIWRHDVLGEIDRGLGRLELLPVVHDDAGFSELRAQLVGVLVGHGRRDRPPAHPPEGSRTRDCGTTEHEREAASHGGDAIVSRATCLARRRPVPGRPHPVRPLQTEGRHEGTMIDYEILLMLDPETPDERQQEIVTRTRELIERGGGRFEKHDVWGRRKLAYEIDHKPDGSYHLLTFSAEPAALDEVSRILKITDGVMRHLAVRRPKPGRTTTAATPSRDTDREPEYAAPALETVSIEEE
jgi:small subunit ribosomal protein S6